MSLTSVRGISSVDLQDNAGDIGNDLTWEQFRPTQLYRKEKTNGCDSYMRCANTQHDGNTHARLHIHIWENLMELLFQRNFKEKIDQ